MNELQKYAKLKGYEFKNNSIYLMQNGFDITVRALMVPQMYNLFIQVERHPGETESQFEGFLDLLKQKPQEFQRFMFNGRTLHIVWRATSKLKEDPISKVINWLTTSLREHGFEPNSHCALCSDSEGIVTDALIEGIRMKAHPACKQGMIQQVKANQSGKPKNFFTGLIGALIGAAIGTIPWLVVSWFGWYVGVLSVIIGISSFAFYRWFGGPITKRTKVLILFTTLFGVVFANYAIAAMILSSNGYTIELYNVILLYQEPSISPVLWENLGIGLLFVAFSLPYLYRKVQEQETTSLVIE